MAWSGDLGGSGAKIDKHEVYPPVVSGDHVYVATKGGALYAFPTRCGAAGAICEAEWVGEAQGAIRRSPTVADGSVYVTTGAGRLYGFPAECEFGGAICAPSWVGHTGTPVSAAPVVTGGMLLGTATDGTLLAFPADCGSAGGEYEPAWTARLVHPDLGRVGTPVLLDGVVYALNGWNRLYAFDAATGGRLWTGEATGEITHHTYPNLVPWRTAS